MEGGKTKRGKSWHMGCSKAIATSITATDNKNHKQQSLK
jgi:hypothetical protein